MIGATADDQGVCAVPLMQRLVRIFGLLAVLALLLQSGHADQGFPYYGVQIIESQKNFEAPLNNLDAAVRNYRMGVVGRASTSMGAARQGIEIPGNAVFGVFRNDFAVRMLRASVPARIEAPLRFLSPRVSMEPRGSVISVPRPCSSPMATRRWMSWRRN